MEPAISYATQLFSKIGDTLVPEVELGSLHLFAEGGE
jgi:hypothetical protein